MDIVALVMAIVALIIATFSAGMSWRAAKYMLESEELSRQSTEGLFKLLMYIGQQTGTLQPSDINMMQIPPKSEMH